MILKYLVLKASKIIFESTAYTYFLSAFVFQFVNSEMFFN